MRRWGEGNEFVDARLLAVNAETWEGEGVAGVGGIGAAGYSRLLARIVAAVIPAGNSAFQYNSVLDCAITTLEDNDQFLAVYAMARGRAWTEQEWKVAHATGLWVGAYNAAFEHLKPGPGPVTAGLHEQAEERMRRAGA